MAVSYRQSVGTERPFSAQIWLIGYIRDERSGVESYPYPVKANDILTSTLAAFLFSSHSKRERDQGKVKE